MVNEINALLVRHGLSEEGCGHKNNKKILKSDWTALELTACVVRSVGAIFLSFFLVTKV